MSKAIWTRDFILLSLTSFFMYLVFYALMVVIAIYSLQQLQASNAEAGLAAGDFLLAALIARLFAGHCIESIGKRRMMLWGLLFYVLLQGFYFITTNIYLFAAVRFFHGIAFGFCATAISTLAAFLVPKERRGEGMRYFLLSTTLASAVGPFIGLYAYQNYGFFLLLLVSLSLAVLSLGMAAVIHAPADNGELRPVTQAAKGMQGYFEFKVLPLALLSLVIYLCYSSLLSFFSAYAAEIHMLEAGQYFFLVYSAAIILSRPQVGKLADQRGSNFVVYPSFAAFALGLLLLSRVQSAGMLFLSAALCGLGFGTFAAMAQVIAIQKVTKERIGIALSTVLSISELGTGIGPFLLGGLVGICGFQWMYVLAGVIVIFCGAAYAFCSVKKYV